jgi:hypothetical protein
LADGARIALRERSDQPECREHLQLSFDVQVGNSTVSERKLLLLFAVS